MLSSLLALLYSSQLKTSNTTNYHHTQDHVYHQSSTTPWKKNQSQIKPSQKKKFKKPTLLRHAKKNQSKNYYEKLLTKTTTIVSSSKNHPCLGFLSSIKNMKWNTKHKKTPFIKKIPSKKSFKKLRVADFKKNKTKLRPVLYWVKSKAESTCSAKSVVQLTTKNR